MTNLPGHVLTKATKATKARKLVRHCLTSAPIPAPTPLHGTV